jgi:hypothetical protein
MNRRQVSSSAVATRWSDSAKGGFRGEAAVFPAVRPSSSESPKRPVRAEIEQAHYAHVNNERPSRLIPVILEPGLRTPRLLERFSVYTLLDAANGIAALVAEVVETDNLEPTEETSVPKDADVDNRESNRPVMPPTPKPSHSQKVPKSRAGQAETIEANT